MYLSSKVTGIVQRADNKDGGKKKMHLKAEEMAQWRRGICHQT